MGSSRSRRINQAREDRPNGRLFRFHYPCFEVRCFDCYQQMFGWRLPRRLARRFVNSAVKAAGARDPGFLTPSQRFSG